MKQSITLPFSAACERNKDPILAALGGYFKELSSVLEIGTGTAQHALYFAQQHPHISWQTSDRAEYLDGILAQLQQAPLDNVLPPLRLDVQQQNWVGGARFDAVYTANTLHIMNSQQVEAFFSGLPEVLNQQAWLFIYGPFKYQQKLTSQSNRDFDQSLRQRGVGSAIRDFEWIEELATKAGLRLLEDVAMPANNQCLIWQRVT